MTNTYVEHWIASNTAQLSEDEDSEAKTQFRDFSNDSVWEAWKLHARNQVLTSSTKTRCSFLETELIPLVSRSSFTTEKRVQVFDILTSTYPRYIDFASRNAIEKCLRELINSDLPDSTLVLTTVINWLVRAVGETGSSRQVAPANRHVLLNWTCIIYGSFFDKIAKTSDSLSKDLLRAFAVSLASLLDKSAGVKNSLRNSAIVRSRRAVRSKPELIPLLIKEQLATAKTIPTPYIFAPFLGLSIDVAIHLRPTKGQDSNFGRSIIEASKNDILTFYGNQVIMARSLMPIHVSDAFRGLFKIIDSNDLKNILLPIIEKAILRSPEYSLSTVADLVDGYGRPLDDQIFSKLCSASLNNAKSANAITRAQSIRLFAAVVQYQGDAALNNATAEILTLPCANKTSGVDHRRTLYEMLNFVRPGPQLSGHIVQALPSLITRETDEAALNHLELILSRHLTYQLQQNQSVDSTVIAVFAKEMTSNKPALRRAFCMISGNALWSFNTDVTNAAASFREALNDAFDNCYKSVLSNPLAPPAGPLEGYVAIAILMGSSKKNKDNILQGVLATSSAKPHFLLLQKCYQKLTSVQDEQWFLRALEAVLWRCQSQVESNEVLRSHFGSSLTYLAIESKNLDTRQAVITFVQTHSSKTPGTVNRMIRQALTQRLNQSQSIEQTEERVDIFRRRYEALLLASVSSGDDIDIPLRERIISQNIVISHHTAIAHSSRSLWIELCQKAKVDPRQTIQNNLSDIVSVIWDNTNSLIHSPSIVDAGFQAVTTLVFVEPSIVLPVIVQRVGADLDATSLDALTTEDYNIWKTPEGQLYGNVLEKRKAKTIEKGKDSELRKWEEELRKSLANKRPENSKLSKEDQASINSQLAKESQVRARVTNIKTNAEHGLALIRSIIKANVSELRKYITPVIDLLVTGPLSAGSELVGSAAFETYILLANVCSDRLGSFREWIGISTLRCMGVKTIPSDLIAEPVNSLIIRVLYRLKSYSEQGFLDVSTFCYVNPLITRLIETNASNASDADESLEQLTLTLEFVKQHCAQFEDDTYPRRTTINNLLHIIRNKPQLAQTAVSCLIELGSAMRSNPTQEEISDLLQGVLSQESLARNACLQVLQTFDLTDNDWLPELWLACHDDDEQCSRLAVFIWEDNGLSVPEGYLSSIITYLAHEHANVRTSCAYAISEAVNERPQDAEPTVATLQSFFEEKAKPLAPEFDEYGMVIAETIGRADPWPARLAVALSFEALAPIFPSASIVSWFQFLLTGNAALGDPSEEVRKGLLTAGTAVLDAQGFSSLPELIALFESSLQATNASKSGDHIKEAAVILFGRLARHLDKSDPRVPTVVDRLVEALKTPSESVQIAVSDCLVPLARMIRSNAAQLIESLLTDMFNAPKYAARRGAAYGLAGIVKGLGISSMKEFNIVEKLRAALEDKKKTESRQGALFAFETFSATLGRLFEPYAIYLVPQLLSTFGDASTDVREATQDAAKVIMGNMSAYGVKLILPSLLSGLDEKQWRTKKGSIDLLGSMAFCSPTQLSLSLPTVIPKLTGVLTDSHAQVRGAANQSLKQFGEVISNPEIQTLVPVLLKALSDPAKGPAALSALLKTSFAHYIDSSSLALVIPIIERGLRERSSETKRKAARIVGNMSSLTDPKDFVPYLSRLMPLVHVCLVDPVPEARATAAKALGSLVERLGEVHFPDLVPGLLRTLKSDVSGVDRQGAAQGLSEALSGLGMERLEALLPDIIANASSSKPHVKEGFMSLLVFLPATFGTRFQPHLPKIIQPILNGLADSEEVVREAALKAGRMIIVNYSNRAIDLLLPELETGMFDSSWRIRQSSVTLVGELLFKIAGISGKTEMDDEEELAAAFSADNSRRVLTDLLGPERRDRILAGLYILRQDDISVVRLASIQVWKALVQNTPKTVREILSSVISQILFLLPKPDSDQEKMAVATLAELCRKLGEKVFIEIIRLLQASSKSSDDEIREATCLALVHILPNTLESHREDKEDDLIPIVRKSLVDRAPNVRSAAAQAFDALQEAYGAKAIDETIPTLLEALRQPDENSDTALKALKEVMNVRANVVFPILIPTLIADPITAFNARALASLVTVAGSALTKRLNVILEALLKALESPDCTIPSEITEALRAIMTSVTEDDSLHALMLQLLAWAKDPSPVRRKSTMGVVQLFFSESTADTAYYRLDWLPPLVLLLDDSVEDVAYAAWDALDAFVKSVPKQELESLVVSLRKNLETIGARGRFVRGLSIEGPGRGPGPIVPIILAGLTTGTNEQREYAAYAIGDLVHRTSEAALKPYVVPLTGPLIRVATQSASLPPPVKTAILTALTIMLDTIPNFVKPFFPQLQRTFIKLLLDTTSAGVRSRAADALGSLVFSLSRIDPVVTELITMSKSNDEPIAASCNLALSNVVKNASQHLGEPSKAAISELLNEAFYGNHEESYAASTALLFTHFANSFPKLPSVRTMVKSHVIDGSPSMLTSHIIVSVLTHAPEVFHKVGEAESGGGGNNTYVPGVLRKIQLSLSESTIISRPAREARELVKVVEPWCNELDESGGS